MATSSFSKVFVIKDANSINAFVDDYNTPTRITVTSNRDYDASSKKGVELLKQKLQLKRKS